MALALHRGPLARLSRWLSCWLLLACACLGLLAGCGRSVDDRLAQVRTMIERQDRSGAMVAVKALLQEKPNLGPARLLLGRLLLDSGEPLAAEAELRRALELKELQSEVVPLLARSLLMANQPAKVVADYAATQFPDREATARLKTIVAEAQAVQGKYEDARDSARLALRAAPGHPPARLLLAKLSVASGKPDEAMAEVDALLKDKPDEADAWAFKGDLLARQKAEPEAQSEAYRKALAARPDHAGAHVALISMALARQDEPAARQQHEAMRKALPRHPQTLLYEGQLAFLKGDNARARELFTALQKVMPRNLLLLQSAALVEMRLNALGQADALLTRALQLSPDNRMTRRLAAQAQLAMGQPARALSLLEPALTGATPDAEALTLAARARLMQGDAAAAAALFERAAKARPDDPKIRTAVALSQMQRGQGDAAITELQKIAAGDADTTADLALIATQLQRRAYPQALQSIDRLATKMPGQPLPAQLRGQVELARRDAAAARTAFEQALAADASYYPAVSSLATLDLQAGKAEAARARFEALLKTNPRHAQAHLALAELDRRGGAGRATVAARLDTAIKASPEDALLRLALVDHHLETGNPTAAIGAAQAGLSRIPGQPELLARLGQAQLATGDHQQASTTFNQLIQAAPRSVAGYLGLAEAQMVANDLSGASRSLKRVFELEPAQLPAQRLAILVALRGRQHAEALAQARQVQTQRPQQAVGWLLEGEVYMAQQKWREAAVALRQALTKNEPQMAPARLHHALLKGGQAAEAQQLATSWPRSHPDDLLFLFYLGDEALARKDYAQAETRYREVLKAQPEHALSLNNVAWLMLEQKKPGALDFAERAVKAAPDRAALRDTLALALAAENRMPQALEMQKSALALRPDDPWLRLGLARLLLQAGEKRAAKTELDRLQALGSRFEKGQPEVDKLMASLRR